MTGNTAVPMADDTSLDDGDDSITEVDMGHVMLRPDGYHWQTPDGNQEFGPFDTLEAALADMESAGEDGAEPGETLQEAEDELGVADWIDPDTGELAEGLSTPHLSDE
ncbi:MAG: hypothetical protein WAW73_05225 [Rhodoferax sp.]